MSNDSQDLIDVPLLAHILDQLPDEALLTLSKPSNDSLQTIDKYLSSSFSKNGINKALYCSLQKHEAQDSFQSFLASLHIEMNSVITIYWNNTKALSTTWNIFMQYFKPFCNGMDDFFIIPADQSWLLVYYHDDVIHYGKRKNRK